MRHAKLGQHAKGGPGMQEGHQLAGRAIERLLVDSFTPGAGGLSKLAGDIVRAKSNMMNATVGIFLEETWQWGSRDQSVPATPGAPRQW